MMLFRCICRFPLAISGDVGREDMKVFDAPAVATEVSNEILGGLGCDFVAS